MINSVYNWILPKDILLYKRYGKVFLTRISMETEARKELPTGLSTFPPNKPAAGYSDENTPKRRDVDANPRNGICSRP
jgi:hypothetical protein